MDNALKLAKFVVAVAVIALLIPMFYPTLKNIALFAEEATDGDGVVLRANDPTIPRVYDGTSGPVVLPIVPVGHQKEFVFTGIARVPTAINGRQCAYFDTSEIDVVLNHNTHSIYRSRVPLTSMTVYMNPAGVSCPHTL